MIIEKDILKMNLWIDREQLERFFQTLKRIFKGAGLELAPIALLVQFGSDQRVDKLINAHIFAFSVCFNDFFLTFGNHKPYAVILFFHKLINILCLVEFTHLSFPSCLRNVYTAYQQHRQQLERQSI